MAHGHHGARAEEKRDAADAVDARKGDERRERVGRVDAEGAVERRPRREEPREKLRRKELATVGLEPRGW